MSFVYGSPDEQLQQAACTFLLSCTHSRKHLCPGDLARVQLAPPPGISERRSRFLISSKDIDDYRRVDDKRSHCETPVKRSPDRTRSTNSSPSKSRSLHAPRASSISRRSSS